MSRDSCVAGLNPEAGGEFRRVVERKISDDWLEDFGDRFTEIAPPELTLVVQDSPGVVYLRTLELGDALSVDYIDEAKAEFETGLWDMVDEGSIEASALEPVLLSRKARFRLQALGQSGDNHRLTVFPHELFDGAYQCGRRLRGEAIASRFNFGTESVRLQAREYKPPRQVIFASIEGDEDIARDVAEKLALAADPLVELEPMELVSFWYPYGNNMPTAVRPDSRLTE